MKWWEIPIRAEFRRSLSLKHITDRMQRESATSSHSGMGYSLLLVLERMEDSRTPYILVAHPSIGYVVTSHPEEREHL